MNLKRLLTIGAVLLTSGGLWAQGTTLADPVPQKATFQYYDVASPSDDAVFYLYNPQAKGYIVGGNNYNTRGSISTTDGYKVRVSKYAPEGEDWNGKAVQIEDYNTVKGNKWMYIFMDANGGFFMDRGSQHDMYQNIYPQGDEVYRFGTSDYNTFEINGSVQEGNDEATNAGKFFGWYYGEDKVADKDNYGTRLFWNADPTEAYVDWYFVSTADYDIWKALFGLKTKIAELEAAGGDVTEFIAIYNSTAVTLDGINQAIKDINAKLVKLAESSASVDDPKSMTPLITNPSYDNNNNTGWSGNAPAFQSYTDAEWYDQANVKTYQKITSLPEGVFCLKVKGFIRPQSPAEAKRQFDAGKTEKKFILYAVSGADSVSTPMMNIFQGATSAQESEEGGSYSSEGGIQVPNNMQCAEGYFKKGFYQNSLIFSPENGEATIGLTKLAPANTDWCIWDQWELLYYGKGEDAFQMWLDDEMKNLPAYEDMADIIYTDSYMDDFLNKKDEKPALNKAAISTYLAELKALADSLEANIEAWKKLQTAKNKAENTANDNSIQGQAKDDLGDYLLEVEDILDARTLTTQEVLDLVAKLEAMIDNVVKTCLTEGADVSDKFLVNPDFEQGQTGWSGGPAMGGTATNKCAESFEKNFNVYQEVSDAPVGFYEIEVQAFYRPGLNDSAWPAYVAAGYKADVESEVYMNNYAQKVMCLYDEWQNPLAHDKSIWDMTASPEPYAVKDPSGEGKVVGTNDDGTDKLDYAWFANDMKNTAIAFSNGMYKSTACGIVAKQGDKLRIGIRRQAGGNVPNGNWTIYDNFRLTYQAFNADKIRPALEKAIAETEGHKTDVISNGTVAKLDSAITAGNAALGGSDGKSMFDALAANYDAIQAAKDCAALYQKLSDAMEELLAAYNEYQETADEQVKATALQIQEMMENGYNDRTAEPAEIEAALAQLPEIIAKLKVPAEANEASDENPVDMTALMQSPSFEKDGANSITGWQGTSGYNFGNDATQKGALALEFYGRNFDMYQDIAGLPNGTYEVNVNAFGRNANGYDAYKKWADAHYSIGVIYAIPDDSASMSSIPLQMVWNAMNMEADFDSKTGSEIKDGDGNVLGYIPNVMTDFRFFVENFPGCFKHSIITKVTDGKLRVGIRSDASMADGERWIIQDDWQLTYFGANSSKTVTGSDPTGISNVATTVKAQAVEVYNMNGMRTNGFNKGLNIVKFKDAEGNTTVRKVVVK